MAEKLNELLTAPCVIAAIIGSVIGFGGSVGLYFITRPPPPGPEGEILSPEAREQLDPTFTAHGRLDHIPENAHVWVAVQRGDVLFPKEPEIPRGDQAWVHTFVEGELASEGVGEDVSAGERSFALVLLLVDSDGQAQIHDWFAEGELGAGYPGLEVGADGFTRLHVVEGLFLQPAEGAIEGEVAGTDSGQPIADASFTVDDIDVDGDGRYELGGLAPGCYLVTAAADSYDPAEQIVEVIAGRTASADFALSPSRAIAGEVTDADGQPVCGAIVSHPGSRGAHIHRLRVPPGSESAELLARLAGAKVVTDGDGRYQLDGLVADDYRVWVTADGYNDVDEIVTVGPAEITTYNVELTPLDQPGIASIFPLQANEASSPGSAMNRTEASDGTTVLLEDGQTATWVFELPVPGEHRFIVRYSNDNLGPLEVINLSVDGDTVGEFQAEDTGDHGYGWNIFVNSPPLGPYTLEAGEHELALSVKGGDGYGVEIDHVSRK
jgi:hypothetical protein